MSANLMSLARSGGKFLKLFGDRKMMKQLPYDAEVEWLGEGPAGSYIQTDIPTTKNTSCAVSMEVVNATKVDGGNVCCAIYGLGMSWGFYSYGLFYLTQAGQAQRGKLNFHGYNSVLSDLIQTDDPVRFDVSVSANGSDIVNISCGSFSSSASIKNIKDSGSFILLWNRANKSLAKTRLVEVVFSVDNTILGSFIPVRFTNEDGVSEGAMYDKVSGQLYRNTGTGAFIIGPDKTT